MPEGPYIFPVWNGKDIIGHYSSKTFTSSRLVIPVVSEFKRFYNKQYEDIEVPILSLVKHITKTKYEVQHVLDVRRKSKRQIDLILKR